MSIKLEGKWIVSVYDERATGTYGECTDVEILGAGNWVRFKTASGQLHVTSYPANLRAQGAAQVPGEGSLGINKSEGD